VVKKQVIVIGGGVAGTAAANALVRHGHQVTIIEKENRLGGRIYSQQVSGTEIEMGAGFITTGYSNVRAFLHSQALDTKLLHQHSTASILRDAKLRTVTIRNLAGNSALSWDAKMRVLSLLAKVIANWQLVDVHAPWLLDKLDNQSVSDNLISEGDREFLEYVLDPILDGYFYWKPEQISRAMLLIICKILLLGGTSKLRDGLRQIPEKAAEGSTLMLGSAVRSVRQRDNGTYHVAITQKGHNKTLQADGLVCAVPAPGITAITPGLNQYQQQFFSSIKYSSTVVLAQTFYPNQIKADQSIAFPRQEKTKLSAITVSTDATTHVSTVKIYASGAMGSSLCDQSDKVIMATLNQEIQLVRQAIFTGNAKPLSVHIQR
jgi:protoporphyrinogen oxidase